MATGFRVIPAPDFSVSGSRAIILAPHATCPKGENPAHHFCDHAAPVLAQALRGSADDLLMGDVPRTKRDLNRVESEGTKFQDDFGALLEKRPAMVLDAHSYPPNSPNYGPYDVALLVNNLGTAQRLSLMIADSLTWKGYKVLTIPRHDYDWNVTKAEQAGIPGILVEANELLRSHQIQEVADEINRSRRAFFAQVPKRFKENPMPRLAAVTWVFYHCDEQTQVGLCGTHPGELWKHQFKSAIPIIDLTSGRLHGKIRLLPTGINDWEGAVTKEDFFNGGFSPRWRIGKLVGFQLNDGRQVIYPNGASIWTDDTMSRLYVMEHNPGQNLNGIPELKSREEYEELKHEPRITAFYFFSPNCPHCVDLKPHLQTIGGLFERMVAIDVQDFPDIMMQEGVKSIPKIHVYMSGEKLDEIRDLKRFAERIESFAGASGIPSSISALGAPSALTNEPKEAMGKVLEPDSAAIEEVARVWKEAEAKAADQAGLSQVAG